LDDYELFFNKSIEQLEDAKFLFDNEKYDISINRAYYAVFYAAKALLAKKDIFPKKHSGTIQQFSLEYVKNDDFDYDAYIGLNQLQEDRRIADYDLLIKFDEERAEKDIEKAEAFIEECRRFI
jgi:uncharacterized protein (UPF0332 family)